MLARKNFTLIGMALWLVQAPSYSCDVTKNGNSYDCTWTTTNTNNIRAEVGVFAYKGEKRTKIRTRFSKKTGSIEVSRFPAYEP